MVTFDKAKDPSRCTGSGDRYSIDGCSVVEHRGKHYIAATDGKMLSMVACEVDPRQLANRLLASRSERLRRIDAARMMLNGTAKVISGGAMQEWQPIADRFPDVCAVVNDAQKDAGKTVTVSLNAELLADLQKALGAGAVTLRIPVDNKSTPIVVEHCNAGKGKGAKDGSFGLLMQISK